ncbi:Predicted dehydrogenase [Micromonospora haikouensis]|uniref:Predicted dehydrogenase n=1 Tax=Micromonospora haikouensis TaxID=686309 RepID=A0A1C4XXT6_9ACTN|nr:Gfo/Idh/MocA family oxidoreductase [Micromonospora haikouensis]SCF13280.1 Predicted dehydrogenase [Micromonospora haikouensis]
MTTTDGIIRWGVLGATSYIAGLVMPAIAGQPHCRLVGLAGRSQHADRVAALADEYDATGYPDYQALLDSPDIDAIYVALPNSAHVEWCERALAAGKHVLVEKPLAMSVAEAERIARAAERADRQVMEAFMYRFHPQQRRAAELLASGIIGQLRVVRASFAFEIPSGSGNIRLDPALGGGATWDVGCYPVDVARLFFNDRPISAYAQFTVRAGESVETSAVGVLDFGEGRRAVLDYSIDYGPRAWYELQGGTGSITVHNAWAMGDEPGRLTVRTSDGPREETLDARDHYAEEVAAFSEALRRGAVVPHSLNESIGTVSACAALLRSAATGSAVPIDKIDGRGDEVSGSLRWR